MRPACAAAALLLASGAAALEPRFDHRDTHGPAAELVVGYDTVAVSGRSARGSWRPALRVSYGFDALGEGNELLVGLQGALRSWDDPRRERVSLAADLRYRSYFGTEELKTFFDFGAWVPVRSRLAVGPMIGLGVQYDFSRYSGVYASGSFGTAFGQARVASFSTTAGAQLRF